MGHLSTRNIFTDGFQVYLTPVCSENFKGLFMKVQTVPRLALNEVLRIREGGLLVLAPVCKSFSIMSRVQTYLYKLYFFVLG